MKNKTIYISSTYDLKRIISEHVSELTQIYIYILKTTQIYIILSFISFPVFYFDFEKIKQKEVGTEQACIRTLVTAVEHDDSTACSSRPLTCVSDVSCRHVFMIYLTFYKLFFFFIISINPFETKIDIAYTHN